MIQLETNKRTATQQHFKAETQRIEENPDSILYQDENPQVLVIVPRLEKERLNAVLTLLRENGLLSVRIVIGRPTKGAAYLQRLLSPCIIILTFGRQIRALTRYNRSEREYLSDLPFMYTSDFGSRAMRVCPLPDLRLVLSEAPLRYIARPNARFPKRKRPEPFDMQQYTKDRLRAASDYVSKGDDWVCDEFANEPVILKFLRDPNSFLQEHRHEPVIAITECQSRYARYIGISFDGRAGVAFRYGTADLDLLEQFLAHKELIAPSALGIGLEGINLDNINLKDEIFTLFMPFIGRTRFFPDLWELAWHVGLGNLYVDRPGFLKKSFLDIPDLDAVVVYRLRKLGISLLSKRPELAAEYAKQLALKNSDGHHFQPYVP